MQGWSPSTQHKTQPPIQAWLCGKGRSQGLKNGGEEAGPLELERMDRIASKEDGGGEKAWD